jgi:hypothetical protein
VAAWYFQQRAMQQAADAAAVAAAINNCTGASCGVTYDHEAKAVATSYGFSPTATDTTVTAASGQTCPDTKTTCYTVTITKKIPVYLASAVGFLGNTTRTGGGHAQTVGGYAMAEPQAANTAYCMIALKTGTGNGFRINGGASNVDLNKCDVFSNSAMKCDGSNSSNNYYDVPIGNSVAGLNNSPCGAAYNGNESVLADPYSGLASNIPTADKTSCATSATTLTAPATLDLSTFTSSNPKTYCGLTIAGLGTVTITTASPGSVIVIEGGQNLQVNTGTNLVTTTGGLTIVFTNAAGNGKSPGFVTSGSGSKNTTPNLSFGAPTSGVWSGVALYQDPGPSKESSISYQGNAPAFNLQGLIYTPNADFGVSGAINQWSTSQCIALVAYTILVSGGGNLFADPTKDCVRVGLTIPTASGTGTLRAVLVQ